MLLTGQILSQGKIIDILSVLDPAFKMSQISNSEIPGWYSFALFLDSEELTGDQKKVAFSFEGLDPEVWIVLEVLPQFAYVYIQVAGVEE
jgi:hypothetical protein